MAQDFDGTNDKIEFGTTKSYWNFMHNTTSKWTMSMWYRLHTSEPDAFYIFLGDGGAASQHIGVSIWIDDRASQPRDHELRILIGRDVSLQPVIDYASSVAYLPKDTNWHHLCLTWDQSLGSNNLSTFIDGGSEENGTKTADTPSNLNSTFVMTAGETNGAGDMDGDLGELGIWNDILTDEEITALSNGVSPNQIRRNTLKSYHPFYGLATPEPNLANDGVTDVNGIVTGATKTDHAPVGRYVLQPRLTIIPLTPPQFARPDGDQAIGSWTDDGGGTTNIYQSIDETVASDSDFIQSETNPASNSLYEATLSNVTDPAVSTGHIVRYRYRKDNADQTINIVVRLKQGASTIASATHSNISTSFTAGTFTLSGAEADNITVYT